MEELAKFNSALARATAALDEFTRKLRPEPAPNYLVFEGQLSAAALDALKQLVAQGKISPNQVRKQSGLSSLQ